MSTYNSKYHQSKSQLAEEEMAIKAAVINPARFDVIYNKYFLSIYKYVLVRVEDTHIADDIVSRVFAKALHKIKQFKFKGYPFSSWLYRIAYNEMNDSFRRKKASRVVQVPMENIHEIMDGDSQEEEIEKEEKIQMVLKAIRTLSQEDVDLLEMRFFEKRPFREIGNILNIKEENAKVKTHRVIKKLKKHFANIKI